MPHTTASFILLFLIWKTGLVLSVSQEWPCPFSRLLRFESPPLSGDDVTILQSLLARGGFSVKISGTFDETTRDAVRKLQAKYHIDVDGECGVVCCTTVLDHYLDDHYKDDGTILRGYKYKVHVPVYRNRSIETVGKLYDRKMNLLHTFPARTHGQDNPDGSAMNMLCGYGSTPTGLMTFDLNSPEDDPVDYGPYPVNRAVQGLQGNSAIVISEVRDGILLHTGEWSNWNDTMPMPNSHGCIHSHPSDIKHIWELLLSIGVQVRNNTFGKLPYPYPPQGLLSVEQID